MELTAYRTDAEAFTAELMLEYYRHYAGLQEAFEIEAIYERHADLFSRGAVDELRELASDGAEGDEARSRRALFAFAVEGHLGQATKDLDAELARREAELQIEVDGLPIGFRESAVVQQNEPDADRRARIEAARLETTESRAHAAASRGAGAQPRACAGAGLAVVPRDVPGRAGDRPARARAPDRRPSPRPPTRRSPRSSSRPCAAPIGVGLDGWRRSDLPWFFRAQSADVHFSSERLVASFRETMGGLGIDVDAQANVILDVEQRAQKSPRAFCAPVRVPAEVYLVVPPVGGRDDYFALFHEGGHAQHFAHVDPGLRWEFRALGDNSITEGFAFLFDHLIEDPEWLRRRLGVEDPDGELAGHARAQQLVYMRRYGAKLAYELELHGEDARVDELAPVYARRLSDAVRVAWPAGDLPHGRRPGLLRGQLSAGLGARDPPARRAARALRSRLVRRARSRRVAEGAVARRPAPARGRAPRAGIGRRAGLRRDARGAGLSSSGAARSRRAPSCGSRAGARGRAPCAAPRA